MRVVWHTPPLVLRLASRIPLSSCPLSKQENLSQKRMYAFGSYMCNQGIHFQRGTFQGTEGKLKPFIYSGMLVWPRITGEWYFIWFVFMISSTSRASLCPLDLLQVKLMNLKLSLSILWFVFRQPKLKTFCALVSE